MKIPIIKYGKFWLLGKNTIGLAFYPYIFLNKPYFESILFFKESKLAQTERHERIHIRQQQELFVIPFYVLYFLFYFINIFKKVDSYRNIPFEKEAYANDDNLEYLKTRKKFAWTKYL